MNQIKEPTAHFCIVCIYSIKAQLLTQQQEEFYTPNL